MNKHSLGFTRQPNPPDHPNPPRGSDPAWRRVALVNTLSRVEPHLTVAQLAEVVELASKLTAGGGE